MPTRWPSNVYDYKRSEIVNDAVGAIDAVNGTWIECKLCRVRRQCSTPFTLQAWSRHCKTQQHQEMLRKRGVSAPSATRQFEARAVEPETEERFETSQRPIVKPRQDYSDFAAAMMESIEKDTDYLVFYRQELQKRAKEEAQAKKLLQKMALLVTEQQEDMDELRDKVSKLTSTVSDLRSELATKAPSFRSNPYMQPKKRLASQPSQERFLDVTDWGSRRRTGPRLQLKQGMEDSDDEIDLFDSEIQFMQG